ncbi:hypothetical protein NL676_037530 [Syzygium grande]|nr:hypothetical protein NL676_037530 [Syzygium grande]
MTAVRAQDPAALGRAEATEETEEVETSKWAGFSDRRAEQRVTRERGRGDSGGRDQQAGRRRRRRRQRSGSVGRRVALGGSDF